MRDWAYNSKYWNNLNSHTFIKTNLNYYEVCSICGLIIYSEMIGNNMKYFYSEAYNKSDTNFLFSCGERLASEVIL